jgi:hypothetical protein
MAMTRYAKNVFIGLLRRGYVVPYGKQEAAFCQSLERDGLITKSSIQDGFYISPCGSTRVNASCLVMYVPQ